MADPSPSNHGLTSPGPINATKVQEAGVLLAWSKACRAPKNLSLRRGNPLTLTLRDTGNCKTAAEARSSDAREKPMAYPVKQVAALSGVSVRTPAGRKRDGFY